MFNWTPGCMSINVFLVWVVVPNPSLPVMPLRWVLPLRVNPNRQVAKFVEGQETFKEYVTPNQKPQWSRDIQITRKMIEADKLWLV